MVRQGISVLKSAVSLIKSHSKRFPVKGRYVRCASLPALQRVEIEEYNFFTTYLAPICHSIFRHIRPNDQFCEREHEFVPSNFYEFNLTGICPISSESM
jgi:hypothetical protein